MENLGFEQALIGSIIAFPERINDLDALVLPSDHTAISNQVLWEKVKPLALAGQLSRVALEETLKATGLLEGLGQDVGNVTGAAYISQLMAMASPTSVIYFAEQVIDASIKRQMGQSIALTRIDLEDNKTADEIMDASESRLWEMRRQKSPGGVPISELLDMLDTTIDDYRSGAKVPAYMVQNPSLARIVPFLEGQDFMVIGARPGEGKSSFMRAEAFQLAQRGIPVCIINMDNGEIDYSRYLVAYASGINSKKLRDPKTLSVDELRRAKSAIQDLKRLPIQVVTLGSPSVEIVLSAMKKAFNEGCKVFFVDYIQCIQNPKLMENSVSNISYSSNQLRGFNMKYKVPVVVASQFSREITGRGKFAAPSLQDFKGSGAIEQDATICVGMQLLEWETSTLVRFPENQVVRNNRPVLAPVEDIRVIGVKIHVLKHRNGPIGHTGDLKWDKATNTYSAVDLSLT